MHRMKFKLAMSTTYDEAIEALQLAGDKFVAASPSNVILKGDRGLAYVYAEQVKEQTTSHDDHSVQICILSLDVTPGGCFHSLCAHIGPNHWLEAHTDVHPTNLPTTSSDQDRVGSTNIALIKNWLRICEALHPGCADRKTPHEAAFLPTRVLDVGCPSSTVEGMVDQDYIRLVDSKSLHGTYVALSHRWGTLQPLVTTRETLESHRAGILFSELSATFKDAVMLTRILGIRYLWIDSLCIIQQDEGDWLHEAALMGAVYANAYCNIAASCATSSQSGFLTHTDVPTPISLHDLSTDPVTTIRIGISRDLYVDVDEGPLNSRGWVAQERLLAPRTIHFTTHGMYWECTSEALSEDGSRNFITVKDNFYYIDSWYTMVGNYSRCNLTYESDKLIAIAGLAGCYNDLNADSEYLAGIWRDDTNVGFLWLGCEKGLSAPKEWRAPSWSWAAWDGEIQHSRDANPADLHGNAAIVEFNIRYKNDASSGILVAGTVTFNAQMRSEFWIGGLVPRDEIIPWILSDYTKCYAIQDMAKERLGWVTLDGPDTITSTEGVYLMNLCSGNLRMLGLGNMQFGDDDDDDDAADNDSDDADENINVNNDNADNDGEVFDDENYDTGETYDDAEDYDYDEPLENDNEEEDDHDDYVDRNKDTLREKLMSGTTQSDLPICFVLVLVKSSPLASTYRRIGLGIVEKPDWFHDCPHAVFELE